MKTDLSKQSHIFLNATTKMKINQIYAKTKDRR